MLNSFQHLVKFFSAFGRHTFHPRPPVVGSNRQDRVFRRDLNKERTPSVIEGKKPGPGVLKLPYPNLKTSEKKPQANQKPNDTAK